MIPSYYGNITVTDFLNEINFALEVEENNKLTFLEVYRKITHTINYLKLKVKRGITKSL